MRFPSTPTNWVQALTGGLLSIVSIPVASAFSAFTSAGPAPDVSFFLAAGAGVGAASFYCSKEI